jgi:hypothetical protein
MSGCLAKGWGLGLAALASTACGEALGIDASAESATSWADLLADGDVSNRTPELGAAESAPEGLAPPPRFCSDCRVEPLAHWSFDDCSVAETILQGVSPFSFIGHPAFRAVQTSCGPGASDQGITFDSDADVVYAPDQPDLVFSTGLTLAAFVKPAHLLGTQTLLRKRYGGSSAFVLAIRHQRLELVLRLADGRNVGVSAPLLAEVAERWTHVAASYDGAELRLYLDGELAASSAADGELAGGAGPIFMGNDAAGRRFEGSLDEVWVNNYAAPAEFISGLQCSRGPELAITPLVTEPQRSGDYVSFDFSVTSLAAARCPVETFEVFPAVAPPLETFSFGLLAAVPPGQAVHVPVAVSSYRSAPLGEYPFRVIAFASDSTLSGAPEVAPTFVVGEGPLACTGTPPAGAAISGSPYSFGRPDAAWPSVGAYVSDEGVFEALTVHIDTRGVELTSETVLEAGLEFSELECVDASAFGGVAFTLEGELGSCSLGFSALFSADRPAHDGRGSCIDSVCRAPIAPVEGLGPHVVRFTDLTGGAPVSALDPSTLSGLRWWFTPPTNEGAEPCVADVTFRDIRFVP